MDRPLDEVSAITGALVRLAAATRDTSIDDKVIRVYMPHLEAYSADEIVDACFALERESEWFPKVKDLLAACSRERRRRQDLVWEQRLALRTPLPPIDPDRQAELMALIRATCRVKAFPKVTEGEQ